MTFSHKIPKPRQGDGGRDAGHMQQVLAQPGHQRLVGLGAPRPLFFGSLAHFGPGMNESEGRKLSSGRFWFHLGDSTGAPLGTFGTTRRRHRQPGETRLFRFNITRSHRGSSGIDRALADDVRLPRRWERGGAKECGLVLGPGRPGPCDGRRSQPPVRALSCVGYCKMV